MFLILKACNDNHSRSSHLSVFSGYYVFQRCTSMMWNRRCVMEVQYPLSSRRVFPLHLSMATMALDLLWATFVWTLLSRRPRRQALAGSAPEVCLAVTVFFLGSNSYHFYLPFAWLVSISWKKYVKMNYSNLLRSMYYEHWELVASCNFFFIMQEATIMALLGGTPWGPLRKDSW